MKTKESEAAKAAEKLKSLKFLSSRSGVNPLGGEDPIGAYSSFDQERQHELFWGFVRDQKWDTVEAFLDKKVRRTFEAKL